MDLRIDVIARVSQTARQKFEKAQGNPIYNSTFCSHHHFQGKHMEQFKAGHKIRRFWAIGWLTGGDRVILASDATQTIGRITARPMTHFCVWARGNPSHR